MTSLPRTTSSRRGRIAAAATAGMALASAGIIALTGGTLAAETSTIKARQSVGIEGVAPDPIGIARTVAFGLDFKRENSQRTNLVNYNTTVDTRSGNAKNETSISGSGWDLEGGEVGVKNLGDNSVKGCASTNGNGNSNRCLRPQNLNAWDNGSESNWYNGIDNNSALVDASTGGPYMAGPSQKYRARIQQLFTEHPHIDIADTWTNVQCHSNGTVSASAPRSWFSSGSHLNPWNSGGVTAYGGHTPPKPNNNQETDVNTYKVYRHRVFNSWTVQQYYEVQSIRQTFSNPPRALSAIIIYASNWNSNTRQSDWVWVSKSECAVSPDGSVNLDPNTHFNRAVPARKQLAYDGVGTNIGATGPIPTPVTWARQSTEARDGNDNAPEGLELVEEGPLEVIDPLTGRPAEDAESPADGESPEATTTPATTAPATPTTAPTTSAATTTTSAGPDPTTAGNTYYAADGSTYQRSGGGTLSAAQRALVDEAILLSETTESGELSDGARFDTAEYQLDGTTLIITNADGGTLRIVREK